MTTKMNPEVKAKWLEALRSGDYEQGKFRLRNEDDRRCCLGVLCDLAVAEGVIEEPISEADGYRYGAEREVAGLPEAVTEWSGVEQMGLLDTGKYPYRYLYRLNDDGSSFEEIADIIEKEL